jgi:hypothetical protein
LPDLKKSDKVQFIYETHRSVWSKEELKRFGESHFIEYDISWICYISSKPNLIDEFTEELKILKKEPENWLLKAE